MSLMRRVALRTMEGDMEVDCLGMMSCMVFRVVVAEAEDAWMSYKGSRYEVVAHSFDDSVHAPQAKLIRAHQSPRDVVLRTGHGR